MNHENVIGLLDVFTPASSLADFQVLLLNHLFKEFFSNTTLIVMC